MFRIKSILVCILFLAFVLICDRTYAQTVGQLTTPAAAPQSATSEEVFNPQKVAEEIKVKLTDLTKEIEASQKALEVVPATPPTEALTQLTRQNELLQKIELTLNQQVAAVQQTQSLEDKRKQTADELEKEKNALVAEAPSYLDLDRIRDELIAEESRKESIDARIETAQTAIEQAKKAFDEKETARRQAREALESSADEAAKQTLNLQLKTAQLESRSAQETLILRQLDIRNERMGGEIYQVQLELLTLKKDRMQGHAVFTQDKLDEQFQRLDKEEYNLVRDQKNAMKGKDTADKLLSAASGRLAQSSGADPALSEDVQAKQLASEALQVKSDMLNARLERLQTRRKAWQRRYSTINGKEEIDTLQEWNKEASEWIEGLNNQETNVRFSLSDRQNQLVTLQNKIDTSKDVSQAVKKSFDDQRKYLMEITASLQDNLANIELSRRLFTKLQNEIKGETSQLSFTEKFHEVLKSVDAVWSKEIYVYKDGEIEKSYYVKTIFYALFFFILGFIVSRILSRIVGRIMRKRIKVVEGAATTIESITYYFSLVIFILFTLRILNVPLTMFTVFGGVFAIAIGFGSQNIMSNFISGVILLVERPVRVGDLVDVEGVFGQVSRMGARCTHIRTFTNQDIIVPNSSFLQNKFINWTLRDRIIRSDIKVGVSYDADSERVEELLIEIVKDHEEILHDPQPVCFFLDFGDSALLFEVRYWVNMAISNRLAIDSRIRHTILKRFREENISIAFPQLDVHLDTQQLIDVKELNR